MRKLQHGFTVFMNAALKFLFFLILVGSITVSIAVFVKLSIMDSMAVLLVNILLIGTTLGVVYLIYKYLSSTGNYSRTILIILGISLVIRVVWVLTVDSKPCSDLAVMFKAGMQAMNGKYGTFKGTSYMARFPHLIIQSIYLGVFQKIFTNALLAVKLVNTVISTISVYVLYLLGSEIYNSRDRGIWIALLACFFPPFIIYNSTVGSENIAIAYFLGSIYLFVLVIKEKKNVSWLIFSGILLAIGNFFRMVAYVVLIAYIMYLIIYWNRKKFVKSTVALLLSFFIPLYIASAILTGLGVTEYPLWKSREPYVTSILKGTNFKSAGMWNKEDSAIPTKYNFNYEKIKTVSWRIIKERLTTPPFYKVAAFYAVKFTAQWSFGDFDVFDYAREEQGILNKTVQLSTVVMLFAQLLYSAAMLYTYIGLFNRKQYLQNKIVNLFYIIFCGYGLLYLITEMDPRYGYIISWVFVMLAFTPDELSLNLRRKKKLEVPSEACTVNQI